MHELERRLASIERRRRDQQPPEMTLDEIMAALRGGRVSRSVLDALSIHVREPVRAALVWGASSRRHLRANGEQPSGAWEPVSLIEDALSYLPGEDAPEDPDRWLNHFPSRPTNEDRAGQDLWERRHYVVLRVVEAYGVDHLRRHVADVVEDPTKFWLPPAGSARAAQWISLTAGLYMHFDSALLAWTNQEGTEWWTSVDSRGHHRAHRILAVADEAGP